jgi:hypothetical protein
VLAMLSCCSGDLREFAVVPNPSGGAVLVTDILVLRDYSVRTDAEWNSLQDPRMRFGDDNWIQHPPAGIFLSSHSKVEMLDRRFLQDGELGEPYAANSFDMRNNGAIDVLYVEVKDGPHRGIRGWLPRAWVLPTVVSL